MKLTRKQKIQQVFEGFMAMQRAAGTNKDQFFQKYNLSRSQVHILYALDHEKSLTVKNIASKMGITSSAITQMLEGLVNAGYLERKEDKDDRRIVHLQFSSKGKMMFAEFKAAHLEKVALIYGVLTDEELDLLIIVPQKLLKRLEERAANANDKTLK